MRDVRDVRREQVMSVTEICDNNLKKNENLLNGMMSDCRLNTAARMHL